MSYIGRNVRAKVFGIMLVIVIVITIMSYGVGYFLTYRQMITLIGDDASLLCSVASKLATKRLDFLKRELRGISEEIQQHYKTALYVNPEGLNFFLEAKAREYDYLSLAIADVDEIIASSGRHLPDLNALKDEYAARAFRGETVISTTDFFRNRGVVIRVYTPLSKGVLIATLPGLILSDLVSEFKFLQTAHIFVLDKKGVIIAGVHPPLVMQRVNLIERGRSNKALKNIDSAFGAMLQGKKGVGLYRYSGEERLAAYMPITGSDHWSIAVAIPLGESAIAQGRTVLLLSALLVLGLGAIVAFFASKTIAKPLLVVNKQNETLTKLKQIAEDASETKSNFIANTSHEMRTPLNAIIGLSELSLNSGEKLPGEVVENLEKIYDSGAVLLSIVNNILDISKIESGKFELIPTNYDLPSLINDTASLNIVRIIERPIEFQLEIDPALPGRLIGDELRIKQIFNNLLSNAFKYTERGKVFWRITCEKEGETVWLVSRVQDSGIGIRQEDIDKLFSDYNQVNVKSNRSVEGTGLGLSITKKMVEMMDGSISVKSVFGKGSIFTVRIKQKAAANAEIGNDIVQALQRFDYTSNKRLRNSSISRAYIPYAKVLVVDDVQSNLDVAKGIMKPYGMHIDCVTSGAEAVRLMREEKIRYNAIFMDHMMPEMDGIEATRIIREEIGTEYAKTIPIIALTANAVAGSEESFLMHGFQAFLSKPVDIQRMDSVINRWVRDKDFEKKHEFSGEAEAEPSAGDKSSADAPDLPGKPCHIKGINFEKGLERFSGDEDTYVNILRSYLASTTEALERIREPKEKDLPDYAIIVHGVKGSSYGVEAVDIAERAEVLELSSKAGDFEFVRQNNPHFILMLEELLENLSAALVPAGGDDGSGKDLMSSPDEKLLERMLEAASDFKLDDMEEVMIELERFRYESENELIVWLRDRVNMMAFPEIRDRLSQRRKA
ncbi:MAG: response regulator [Candidatus Accumulibacter sp.]|jgi:signal transduction histidine kinase/CheY-like chemotaxis protein|nr:response regulator [Accumulibacter sp.]